VPGLYVDDLDRLLYIGVRVGYISHKILAIYINQLYKILQELSILSRFLLSVHAKPNPEGPSAFTVLT
jgi:hypothetical protein